MLWEAQVSLLNLLVVAGQKNNFFKEDESDFKSAWMLKQNSKVMKIEKTF